MNDPDVILKFVKIIERFPEIYDPSSKLYRTRPAEQSWEVIADIVKSELHQEWAVEDIKVKWKGIRSSYNRYKCKLLEAGVNHPAAVACKKYYLYDALKFIEPFVKTKGFKTAAYKPKTTTNDECYNFVVVEENSEEYHIMDPWDESDVKPDITNDTGIGTRSLEIEEFRNSPAKDSSQIDNCKKRKSELTIDDDNEDLQFFKSILPDIKDFTIQEKRKFKMGILKLIDDLENERKRVKKT